VDDRKRMQGVRFEIRRREDIKCGWSDADNSTTIRRKYHELNPDDWGRWLEIQIGEDWQYHVPFKSLLFRVTYHLKVTLEIGWDMDPEINIPLIISDCAPETDVLDSIAAELGMDDW